MKDIVPDFAGHTEAQLVVLVVVLKMIPLLLPYVLGQLGVVQCIVHRVIHDIHRVRAGDDAVGHRGRQHGMREQQHWERQRREKNGRHNEAVAVHRQKVMDAMQQKVHQVEELVAR